MKKLSKADKAKLAKGLKKYRVRQPLHSYYEVEVWAEDEQAASDMAAAMQVPGYTRQVMENVQTDGSDEVEELLS